MTHLKSKYMEVKSWRNHTGNGILEGKETINGDCYNIINWTCFVNSFVSFLERIRKKCPFFNILDQIFGQKRSVNPPELLDTLEGVEEEQLEQLEEEYLELEGQDEWMNATNNSIGHQTESKPIVNGKTS